MSKHGQYIQIWWEDCPTEEYVRGHVTLAEAQAALNRFSIGMGDAANNVAHKFARWVPIKNCEYDREMTICEGPTCGAFPITEVTFKAPHDKD